MASPAFVTIDKTPEGAQAAFVDAVKNIELTCKLAIDGKKGKSDGPGQGQGPGSGFTHSDGMGMAPRSSIPGQYDIPGGIGSYGGYTSGLLGQPVRHGLNNLLNMLPGVRLVLPGSYSDVKNKDYGGEPFINGQAVPYDPKYHEEWIRNNNRANERNSCNDRPRNFDRSRNFERRRENIQNRDFQNTGPSPIPNQAGPNSGPGPANMGPPPPNRAPMPPPNMGPPNNYSNPQPSNNWNSGPPNNYNQAPPNRYNQMPPNNYNQMPPNNLGGLPPNNMAPPSKAGWNDPGQYQNSYTPDRDAGVNPGPNRY